MSPELDRHGMAATGQIVQRSTAGSGEVVIECPRKCGWSTVRPDRPGYVRSALLAHEGWEHSEPSDQEADRG